MTGRALFLSEYILICAIRSFLSKTTDSPLKKVNRAKNAKYDVLRELLASVYERYTEKSRLDSLKNMFKT